MKITMKDIIQDSDPQIRTRSEKVDLPLNDEDRGLLEALLQYVRDSQDDQIAQAEGLRPAVGIAAIQVGVPKQLLAVVVDDPDREGEVIELALANPKIVSRSVQHSYLKDGEGCLSVPDEHPGHAFRHARIKVRAYDLLSDAMVQIDASGFLAICLQHEIDHLSGILYYDRIDAADPMKTEPGAEEY